MRHENSWNGPGGRGSILVIVNDFALIGILGLAALADDHPGGRGHRGRRSVMMVNAVVKMVSPRLELLLGRRRPRLSRIGRLLHSNTAAYSEEHMLHLRKEAIRFLKGVKMSLKIVGSCSRNCV